MMRMLLITAALCGVLGCKAPSPETPPKQTPGQPGGEASPAPAGPEQEQVSMTGSMTLRFFEPAIGGEQPQGATFEVSSPRCSLLEDGVWALTPATAIIYGKDDEKTTFEAGSAQFDDNTKTASLKDGVKVDIGVQHVELQDMTWSNEEGVARSDNAVTITDGDTKLTAQGMEFRSESRTMLLKGVTGTVALRAGGTS
ncbi:MAG: LPS export ABC transporter periplasmic protein LptC [Candidatus Hydrogenedentes bacterium]|nr:LPS export ABC transporter periplasmic protein LptC [Candidatus Hydrogenedentota bacterium]